MEEVAKTLAAWRASHVKNIPVAGLITRNPIAYKWKAPFRCWLLREAVFWRITDLLTQSHTLYLQEHGLGARILLRSAFETLAVLVRLNQLTKQTIESELSFHEFSRETEKLLLGSKDGSTGLASVNIMTTLGHCEKRYPGLAKLYGILSESAHPNYEGMVAGYSKVDHGERETHFANRWMAIYGGTHPASMRLCMETFEYEYDAVWRDLMENLENWIELNDAELEATKDDYQ